MANELKPARKILHGDILEPEFIGFDLGAGAGESVTVLVSFETDEPLSSELEFLPPGVYYGRIIGIEVIEPTEDPEDGLIIEGKANTPVKRLK